MLSKTLTQAQQKSAWARLLDLNLVFLERFGHKKHDVVNANKKCQISAQMSGINYPQLSDCSILSFLSFIVLLNMYY